MNPPQEYPSPENQYGRDGDDDTTPAGGHFEAGQTVTVIGRGVGRIEGWDDRPDGRRTYVVSMRQTIIRSFEASELSA